MSVNCSINIGGYAAVSMYPDCCPEPCVPPDRRFVYTGYSNVSLQDAFNIARSGAISGAIENDLECQCNGSGNFVELRIYMDGPVDDDLVVIRNGQILQGDIQYWDYLTNDWSYFWKYSNSPNSFPESIENPITGCDRSWNLGWYSLQPNNYIKIKYNGELNVGDLLEFYCFDGWQDEYKKSTWLIEIQWPDGLINAFTGGVNETGVSSNLPSPPRYNPSSPFPYNTANNFATGVRGLPNNGYYYYGFTGSGPFFHDYHPMGCVNVRREPFYGPYSDNYCSMFFITGL